MDRLSDPEKFSYVITSGEDGLNIYLTYRVTGEVKTFYQAGSRLPIEPFMSHMDSLTDDLMTSFFVKFGGTKKKEKKSE